ncbi:MAG: arsenosugar biosynthesis radical SAM (seleno)protein ArsS [Planctomycetota bacterium]
MTSLTLLRSGNELASADRQREILEAETVAVPRFAELLSQRHLLPPRAAEVEVLQVNVGKVCNQTCRHCHVDAGPDRRERMSDEVVDACLRVLQSKPTIQTLDITGGAPEMHPRFRDLVREARALGKRVIDRCNLTILVAPGFTDLPEFLAEQRVEVVASLPCYLEENVDRQRGDGVFERSLEGLRRLNQLGYGQPDTGLELNLVFNPLGPSLPPNQQQLEADYRRELRSRYGIEFNRLYTITNLPISRFLDDLLRAGKFEAYLQKLLDAFQPANLGGLMCRTTLSVDWQGKLFDCDFNQMLELGVEPAAPQTILELGRSGDWKRLEGRQIVTGRHCLACTAGAGSSCGGALQSR